MSDTLAVTIIIPSLNNRRYLEPCLSSILRETINVNYQIIVVNNCRRCTMEWIDDPRVTVLAPGSNLGWEGGLQLGLTLSLTPYSLFLNDDTLILRNQQRWLSRLLEHFENPQVGAVGPASNLVAGAQAIQRQAPTLRFPVRFLIGFCMLVRRSALNQVGGIDLSLPGGDDIDLSIRLRRAGYSLLCDRRVFVYHHGYKTGERVYGPSNQHCGWNSREFTDRVTSALVAKHGRDAVNETWGTIVA
jgi:GT2 family glycosyltransferase